MSKHGPIILIDDDEDDHEIFADVLTHIGVTNKLIWFATTAPAMNYLITTEDTPFLIFCDMNLPMQNGIEFKKAIDQDKQLRSKSIPFVFYSTSVDRWAVNTAYTETTVQGFFKKTAGYDTIKETLKVITDYWKLCRHPNCD